MYVYLARNKYWYDKDEIKVFRLSPVKDVNGNTISYFNDFLLDTFHILNPEDKPVPMLLDLGKVELPGWLFYNCTEKCMGFRFHRSP